MSHYWFGAAHTAGATRTVGCAAAIKKLIDWDSLDARVALVVAGQLDEQPGGAAMRWRALRSAVDAYGPVVLAEIPCLFERIGTPTCLVKGTAQATDSEWHYDSVFCPAYATRLIEEFTSLGVTKVICTGLETYQYVLRFAEVPGIDVVFDMHNIESELYRSLCAAIPAGSLFATIYNEQELAAVERAESAAVRAADEIWTCSENDRQLLVTTYAGVAPERVKVVPNALEVPEIPPVARDPKRIIFTGLLYYYPNMRAVEELIHDIAPRLDDLGCPLPVVVAGAGPYPSTLKQQHSDNVQMILDPVAPADLIRDSIMAVPLRLGSGSRFKILEAFTLGVPVVSTTKGAEGLEASAGLHYIGAEDPAEFASSIVALAGNERAREELVAESWKLVRDRYSIASIRRCLAETMLAV